MTAETVTLQIPSDTPADYQETSLQGLTSAQAQERRAQGLANHLPNDQGKTMGQIIRENVFTLFNLLNIALGVALLLVGSYRNMLFLGVVVSNTLIGTVQELRARATIRRLSLLNSPTAHAIRDGREVPMGVEDLVQDDLVILRAGQQVPADAIVREGGGAANESLLTGESDAIQKRQGDWLLSGSYISEGRLTAQLVHVGKDSYASRLTQSARTIRRPKSALMTDLNRLIQVISAVLVPLGVLTLLKNTLLLHQAPALAVPSAVAAMVGMIPEGLILLTSVAMAVGVVRLGRRNALVQELYGIETLARVDVLCLDKTGTLTTGEMRVSGYIPQSATEEELVVSLRRFLGAFDEESSTLSALRAAVAPGTEIPTSVVPFSSQRKMSAATFRDGTTYVLGAPSFALGQGFTPEMQALVSAQAAKGVRILAFGTSVSPASPCDPPVIHQLMGFIQITDTLRPNARDTLRYFEAQGVALKIISGDDPRTVAAIAKKAELPGCHRLVDASTLTDEELAAAAEETVVFGRVTPSQKKLLVETLKRNGHSVAMTGDGVNDIPALKAADCSIAMAGGSDAAKHTAQITLLDADFSTMPLIVGEGRRVVNNVTRAASLFLVKTLYSFMLAFLLLLLPVTYPFQPIQLTLVSTLTIGIPAFFLALEPNGDPIRGQFLATVLSRAVPGALAVVASAALAMSLQLLGFPLAACSTLATYAAGFVGFVVLVKTALPLTMRRRLLIGTLALAYVGTAMFFGQIFFLTPMAGREWLAMAGLTGTASAVVWLTSRKMSAITHNLLRLLPAGRNEEDGRP